MRPELVGTSRARILQVLHAEPEPLSSHDLAEACELHVTTVRFHLEILSESGLIDAQLQRHGRGRPRLLYSLSASGLAVEPDQPPRYTSLAPDRASAADSSTESTDEPEDDLDADQPPNPTGWDSGYQALAMLLAANWDDTSGSPADRAQQAGRRAADPPVAAATRSQAPAGRVSATPAAPRTKMSVARAAQVISAEFAERGFSPELTRDGPATVIRLRACPFKAVAQAHPEVVCALHLGLLRGSWENLGAPAVHASLHPFAEPGVCVARLTPTPAAVACTSEFVSPERARADSTQGRADGRPAPDAGS